MVGWLAHSGSKPFNFQNICEKTLQMHFKVAVRNFYAVIVQAGDSLTDALRVVSVVWW